MRGLIRDFGRLLPGMTAAIFVCVVVVLILLLPDWVRDLAAASASNSVVLRFIVALVVCGVLVYFYVFKPLTQLQRAQSAKGLIVQGGRGVAYIDPDSARQQIYLSVSAVPDILKAEVSVTNEMGRAGVTVNVLASHQINGIKKKQDVRREIRKTLLEQLGVGLAHEPVIQLKLTSAGDSAPQAVSPALMKADAPDKSRASQP